MGQQQLLLLVLVFIIVGFGIIVSTNTFQATHDSANADAIRLDIIQAQSVAVSYYRRSVQTGGGGGSFVQIQHRDIMLPVSNDNASYEISERSSESFMITATPHTVADNIVAIITPNGIIWE
jgi:Tfp pilus assembly protein FimT